MRYIIGIDPGQQGGIAVIEGASLMELHKCPTHGSRNSPEYDVFGMNSLINKYRDEDVVIYMEQIYATPGSGSASMLKFGKGFGIWIGIAAANGIPLRFVRPQEWQKEFAPIPSGVARTKHVSIDAAKKLFPDADLKPGRKYLDDDNLAEAILIAAYGGLKEYKKDGC